VTALLQAFHDLMDSQPGLVGWVFAQLIVLPLTVLLHELGHAAMAAMRAQADVRLEVGSGPVAWRGRLARIDMAVHPLVMPAGMGGAVSFDATRASATDVLLVALAGPLTSLIGTVFAWIWFASTPDDSWLSPLLAVAALTGLLLTVVNLLPMSIRDRNGAVMWRTDGWHALSAARVLLSLQ
jgi:Zn-dependent protease